jgi:hypothetical protein
MLWARFEEVLPGGDPVLLGAEEFQLLAGGKTRAHFLSWSNGGPREQTITSSTTKPDSLQASFSLEHRLLLVAGAGGTVTASVPGDLSAGLYLTQGTSVTLTATALPGFIFLGWRGDTVATGGTLDLSLRRGYDFEARFVAQVSVANADAVRDLLGTPTLTDVQRGFLDELGNRNGVLDVGDILAMFRRTGLAVPPAFRQAAEAVPSRRRGEVRP